jgi:ribosomal protein S18 acetylase RimI-like enzyme
MNSENPMNTELDYIIRPLTQEDEPFLWEILYHAIYVAEGDPLPERDVIKQTEVARYVRDWGCADDSGFIAIEAFSQQPIGAAWLRLLTDDNKGYGYIDDATPELSLAVLPDCRGKGIGIMLLTKLLQTASIHCPAVSLSVAPDNPALRLYKRLGFEVVGTSGTSLTMMKKLSK